MSEDSEAERKGSSAGEPSQLETRAALAAVRNSCDTCSRLLVVKLTNYMAPSHVGSLEHAHWPRAPLPPGLHAPSGARRVWLPSVNYI